MHLGLLKKGQIGIITGIHPECKDDIRQRLLDLGFIKGTEIFIQNISPLKNPIAYKLHNTTIALRTEDTKNILINIK